MLKKRQIHEWQCNIIYFLFLFSLIKYTPDLLEFWTIPFGFVLHRTDGIGLSAPQVGINVQLLVFNPAGERGEGEEIVLINPKVHKYSKKTLLFNEGCLSFPGIYADVEVMEDIFYLFSYLALLS